MRRVIARSHRRNDVGNEDGGGSRMIFKRSLMLALGSSSSSSFVFGGSPRSTRCRLSRKYTELISELLRSRYQ
jgi:hypothetical protein